MGTALDTVHTALSLAGAHQARENGDWTCPAHDDHTPSLSVNQGDKGAVLHCQAGCELGSILDAIGLTARDLFDDDPDRPQVITATYDYTDETGNLLYQVVRYANKKFSQRKPGLVDEWMWTVKDVRRVPYHLPAVLEAAKAGGEIHVTEGEKDADALTRAAVVATCNSGGAGSSTKEHWTDEHSRALTGAGQVWVWADKDQPGRDHAQRVAASLARFQIPHTVVEAATGKDAADHLAAGFGAHQFVIVGETESVEADKLWAHLKQGSRFVLDDPAELDPVWGADDAVAWASGESLLIVGPTGVGKTTLQNLLIAARCGIIDNVLGWPVKPADRPILLMAMDRPRQARRALRRLFGEQHRQTLDERLMVWEGPPPADLGRHPEILAELVDRARAGTVFIDSLKDAAVKLGDDEVGGNVNRAIQTVTTAGIEVVGLHHQRKGQGGTKPRTLEDVYGSTWITAGAGSVLILWGTAGDPIVELSHLKQPAAELGPFKIEHDATKGEMSIFRGFDALRYLRLRGATGCTVIEAARAQFEKDPNDNEQRKTRRLFESLVAKGQATRDDAIRGGNGGATAAHYYINEPSAPIGALRVQDDKSAGQAIGAGFHQNPPSKTIGAPSTPSALEDKTAGQTIGAVIGAIGSPESSAPIPPPLGGGRPTPEPEDLLAGFEPASRISDPCRFKRHDDCHWEPCGCTCHAHEGEPF